MYKLAYSPKSLEDLQSVKDIISERHGQDTATLTIKKMINTIRRLEQFPYSGRELSRISEVQTSYLYLFTEKNYVFYRIDGDTVRIVRILNERQDFMQILFGISTVSNTDEYNSN
ncbi:hypothetical protein CSC2_06660 [Clostridium zeae]|uniref:Type II toxin-antitoxin system RelE/ParE family toxin n=1 Tax=Clostridium zeae TaxID=2759022 RepID=A0ABQ1E5V3_9CLOT|nr:type II toxin-antitoxin system RelE/ParE family toxin [Clostridium zeae]GFZ30140.1 hypothetical protein CSC2_06660 [Clostridium zeae]